MSDPGASVLRHELLAVAGDHGFGTRSAEVPDVVRPVQVHGSAVAVAERSGSLDVETADAVISQVPGVFVAIVTADCVPVLSCSRDGAVVGAIHAGWRGLSQGVVQCGLDALSRRADAPLRAVVGPHIGSCCYEVDEPVESALRERFGAGVEQALAPSRPGHHFLDLGSLVRSEIQAAGVASDEVAVVGGCTQCQPERFHSFRRDGEAAGRMTHFIAAR